MNKQAKISIIALLAMVMMILGSGVANAQEGDCPKFVDPAMEQDCLTQYSLFYEFYKQDNFADAMKHWRFIYKNAPGLRETTYTAGEKMYTNLRKEAADAETQSAYLDSVLMIYDRRMECFPKKAGMLKGKKARQLYIHRKDEAKDEIYKLTQESMEMQGNETEHYLLVPYYLMEIEKFNNQEIDEKQLMEIYNRINEIVDWNLSNNEKKKDKYQEAIDAITPTHEGVVDQSIKKEIQDCPSAKDYYEPKYRENPEDLDILKKIYGTFIKMDCTDDPLFLEVAEQYNRLEPSVKKCRYLAGAYYKQGNETKAFELFENGLTQATDPEDKADIYWSMAKIYRYDKKDYSSARKYARLASDNRPGWGQPFLFIGEMYAASGARCKASNEFLGWAVSWVAVDMFAKAKQVDPSVSDKANQMIGKYAAYFPEREVLFQRDMSEGSSYTVGCWIGQSTRVRAKK